MIELLVVIAILGLLTALAVTAIAPMLENAKVAATRATIMQLDRMVQDRLNAFTNVDMKSQIDLVLKRYNSAGNTTPPLITLDVATVLTMKDRYKAAFPQCEGDLWGFNGNNDTLNSTVVVGDDAPLITYWNDSSSPPNTVSEADNSELFYLFLSQGQTFGIDTPNLDEINPKHIGDTDGDNRLEFLDDWGNPLRFYNAPTQLIQNATAARKLFATLPTPSTQDPFDPLGRISLYSSASPFRPLAVNTFKLTGSGTAQPVNAAYYYDNDIFFAYLIVSSGPDGSFGLGSPTQSGNAQRLAQPVSLGDIDDNISNRQ